MPPNNPIKPDFRPEHFVSLICAEETGQVRDPAFVRLAQDIGTLLKEASLDGQADDVHAIAKRLSRADSTDALRKMFLSQQPALDAELEIPKLKTAIAAAGVLENDGLKEYVRFRDRRVNQSKGGFNAHQIDLSEVVLDAAQALAEKWCVIGDDHYWKNADEFVCEGVGDEIFYREIYQAYNLRRSEPISAGQVPNKNKDEVVLPTCMDVELKLSTAVAARTLELHGLEEYKKKRDHLVERFGGALTVQDLDSSSQVLSAAHSLAKNLVRLSFQEYQAKTQELIDAGIGNSELYSHVYFSSLRRWGWGT